MEEFFRQVTLSMAPSSPCSASFPPFILEWIPTLWGQVYQPSWILGFALHPHFQVIGVASFFPIAAIHLPSPLNPEVFILFSQGDKEAELGLPFSPLCDRTSTLVAQSQIGESAGKRKGDVWFWPGLF